MIRFANGKVGFRHIHYSALQRRITEARVVINENGKTKVLVGESVCHPSDNFCKETGRKIALTRAIKSLPKSTRAEIWHAYFSRGMR